MVKLVCGVGINDVDYPVKPRGGDHCPFHRVWSNMLARCYSTSYHSVYPAYDGCTVTEEWYSLNAFRGWMVLQDWEGKHLDKDLKIPGDKIYCPQACVFVSQEVNNFLIDRNQFGRDLPRGITLNRAGSYVVQCGVYVGSYQSLHDAQLAYNQAKQAALYKLASKKENENIREMLLRLVHE